MKSFIILTSDKDKINAIQKYVEDYSLESEDLVDMIYSEIFKVEE